MVLIAPPPPSRTANPEFYDLLPGYELVRLFDPTRYGASALGFRRFGPIVRFDHQTGQGPDRTPSEDASRGIYYAALTLSGALVEVFGDQGSVSFGDWHVAVVQANRPLRLLDLRGPGAMRAGSVAALAKIADRSLSQAWSRYFYENPRIYGAFDGIIYYNAHNDEPAVALYERCEGALAHLSGQVSHLAAPALRPLILDAANQNNLDLFEL